MQRLVEARVYGKNMHLQTHTHSTDGKIVDKLLLLLFLYLSQSRQYFTAQLCECPLHMQKEVLFLVTFQISPSILASCMAPPSFALALVEVSSTSNALSVEQ